MKKFLTHPKTAKSKAAAFCMVFIFLTGLYWLLRPSSLTEYATLIILALLVITGFMGEAYAQTFKTRFLLLQGISFFVVLFCWLCSLAGFLLVTFCGNQLTEKELEVNKQAAMIFAGIGICFAVIAICMRKHQKKRCS